MPSPRSRFETACRIGAFAVLGWMLGSSVIPSSGRRLERATSANVGAKLAAWTRLPSSVVLHGDFATSPDAWAVDWLSALKRSGHVVRWSGSPPAVAMSAEAMSDPNGAVRIDVAAPAGATVLVRDDASTIDSVRVTQFGASIVSPMVVGGIVGHVGNQRFSTVAPDTARVRSVVVAGSAGWEGKFVVSALEERGWPVIARFSVAPSVDVTQGAFAPIDTARVAAVILLDSVGAKMLGASLERFVRSGGGLVLAGASSLSPTTSTLAPGALGARFRPAELPQDTIRLGSTGFYPVLSLKQDGVALERRSGGIAVAARRVGAGRVVQVGYDDSWRWRMAGGVGSERAHREWWSRLVASVAYVPGSAAESSVGTDPAPVARLVERLGPSRDGALAIQTRRPVDKRLLVTLIMILLIAEWASRRWRGLR
ncbi:MAG TPA: hypothetical protein VK636_04240 [Gemmatimonadaceae bacterium]|nr:hypothetical protein [Gemmatimonadaceae bacterium]